MAAFSDYYPVFPNPIWPLFDFQDKKLGYDVTNHLPDPQYMEFSPGGGLAGYYSCEATAAQGINLSKPGDNAPLYLYESTMESSRLQEIINPSMISDEQGASPTFYGPSLGVDHGEPAGLKSTGREEIMGCDANYQLYHTPADGSGMEVCLATNNTACAQMKRRKTDANVAESVFETNVLVALKVDEKLKSDRCKSRPGSCATKDREEKSNPKLDVIMQEPPELLPSIVMKEPKAESGKDYIHVRAARGQATDRHSLAERVRRQKISDRMNVLQSLVPGCNKITNKALLLEEIIKYVQSLQNQVEILSMKLACISPLSAFDHQITGHSFKDSFPVEATPDPVVAYGTTPHYVDHTYTVTQHSNAARNARDIYIKLLEDVMPGALGYDLL